MRIGEQLALWLIAEDCIFYTNVVTNPRFDSVKPLAILTLMPFLSALINDSSAYLEGKGLVTVRALDPHRELLVLSRQRIKLLDDNRQSFDDILSNASRLSDLNSQWFFGIHQGFLAPLKRLLQPDLGLYFIQDQLFCTTHVAFLNLGVTEDSLAASSLDLGNLEPFLRNTVRDFGHYVGLLSTMLGLDIGELTESQGELVPAATFQDLKSARFYSEMTERIAPDHPAICLILTSILSQVNTGRLLVPLFAQQNSIAAFKIRFLSLYHAAANLQRLLNQDGGNQFLTTTARTHIGDILRSTPIRNVRKYKTFRDHLIHYGIDEGVEGKLSEAKPLFGLPEALCQGKPLEVLLQEVDSGLDFLAVGLQAMLLRDWKANPRPQS